MMACHVGYMAGFAFSVLKALKNRTDKSGSCHVKKRIHERKWTCVKKI